MRSDWPIVAAAWLITLLAATLLAAGPIYSDAVSLAGLRRVLAEAPTRQVNIEASALVSPTEVRLTGDEVGRQLAAAVGSLGADVQRSARSDTFALPDQPENGVRDLALLGFVDGIERHATLVEGIWPETSGGTAAVEVAASDRIADALGWAIGDELTLTNRRDEGRRLEIRLVGVFSLDDPQDPFWWGDELMLSGATESSSYRTFGPLITTPGELLGRVMVDDVRVTWRAFPYFDRIELEQVDGLQARVAVLPERISFALASYFPNAGTDLHLVLADAQRSLLVTRTGVLLLIVQLAVLAAYAIVLTAGLMAEHRRLDTSLLRSRGAGPLQVAWMALTEALVLAAPAALGAPFLAAAALRLFNVAGPLAAAEVEIAPQLSTTAFAVSAGAAVGAALLLVVPAFLAARSFVDEDSGRSRFETRTIGQRLGIDIALLAVTVIGFWQLRLYGAPLTESVQGTLGLDPLLVAAPAIGLLAGGVLALRIVPLLATAAEALTRRGRRLVSALGAQQVARRPLRYTRAALLLMLAVSMGVFAISYAETWHASQEDQAGFQVGSDVRLEATGGGGTVPPWALESALRRLEGVSELMAVDRQALRLPAGRTQGAVLVLDAAAAGRIAVLREDLSSEPLAPLLAPLVASRPAPALLRLETAPRRLRVDARLNLEEATIVRLDPDTGFFVEVRLDPAELEGDPIVGTDVVVRDARGIIQRFTAAAVPYDPAGDQIVVELVAGAPRSAAAVAEIGGGLTAPLEILSIDLTIASPWFVQSGRVELIGLSSSDQEAGEDWRAIALDADGGWAPYVLRNNGPTSRALPDQVDGRAFVIGGAGPNGGLIAYPGPTVGRPPTISFVADSLPPLADAPLPVIVNRAFLAGTAASLGDVVTARIGGLVRRLTVAGVLEAFPTTDPAQPLAIADLHTVGLVGFASSQATISPLEWWLAVEPSRGTAVAEMIRSGPYVRGEITSRDERAQGLSADPVALGVIGALSLGFVVAGLFAVIGLAVSAAVSARQRRTEFALLRALGLSSSQLSGWLWLENAGIVLVSLAAGTGLGLVIGWVVLPFVTVTQQAAAPYPPPLVQTPWLSIGLLIAVSSGALGVTVVVLGRVLRSIGIGSVLRMGED